MLRLERTLLGLDLVGKTRDEAEQLVRAAGGRLRAVPEHGSMTADYQPDRLTVIVGQHDTVIRVFGVG